MGYQPFFSITGIFYLSFVLESLSGVNSYEPAVVSDENEDVPTWSDLILSTSHFACQVFVRRLEGTLRISIQRGY